jgi:AraC-like DNA-binding protein
MLRYLGLGKRHFGDNPMPPHPRMNWEFLAVTRGKIGPYERERARCVPVGTTLWLFPPGIVHGWASERGETCELIVIHYSSVPESVERLARRHGHLETKLRPSDLEALRKIAHALKRHYWQPTIESELVAERALVDLCLLALRDYPERRGRQVSGGSYQRVVAAEEWLRAHLPENPSIEAAADVVGVSVSQLFRLFSLVRHESPQRVLNRVKIDRAMELLGKSNAKLETVALESGFSSASNLCRAFKALKGRSPTTWRRETFIQYKVPNASAKADHTQHGYRRRPAL